MQHRLLIQLTIEDERIGEQEAFQIADAAAQHFNGIDRPFHMDVQVLGVMNAEPILVSGPKSNTPVI